MKSDIKLFNTQQIRTAWDEKEEKWYFSIVDVCAALTDQPDYQKARKYWNKLKQRLVEEGFQLVTNCHQLKLVSPKDGKSYATDVADPEQIEPLSSFLDDESVFDKPIGRDSLVGLLNLSDNYSNQ